MPAASQRPCQGGCHDHVTDLQFGLSVDSALRAGATSESLVAMVPTRGRMSLLSQDLSDRRGTDVRSTKRTLRWISMTSLHMLASSTACTTFGACLHTDYSHQ